MTKTSSHLWTRTLLAVAAAAAAGCTTNSERSDLVALKLVRPTLASGAAGCEVSSATQELIFGSVDPAVATTYTMGLVVENLLPNNANLAIGRLNSNDFQVEQARIDYEFPDAAFNPAIGEHVVPANSLIQVGGTGVVGVQLFPADVIAVLKSAGSGTIRIKVRAEGKFTDGSAAKSSQYEYSVRTCATGPNCLPPTVCAAGKTLFVCSPGQDSDSSCL